MALAFRIQKEYGCFCHESVYQGAFVDECIGMGLKVKQELQVSISHLSFCKHFYVDVLIEGGSLYELKAVEHIVPAHRAQTLTYLMLLGLSHGKIINWRPPSVQAEFVSTSLNAAARHEFVLNAERWNSSHHIANRVHGAVLALLDDWGAFLSADLYRDAIMQIITGKQAASQLVDIRKGARTIGRQPFYLIAPGIALAVSASTTPTRFEKHLQRLLNHTTLENIFWINMNKHNIVSVTLNNETT